MTKTAKTVAQAEAANQNDIASLRSELANFQDIAYRAIKRGDALKKENAELKAAVAEQAEQLGNLEASYNDLDISYDERDADANEAAADVERILAITSRALVRKGHELAKVRALNIGLQARLDAIENPAG